MGEDLKFKHGLVIGKFYPPHAGHHYLIDTAMAQCETLTVQVQYRQDETIHGRKRAAWVAVRHPNAKVLALPNNYDEDYTDSEVWAQHMDVTYKGVTGFPVDAVFASEFYVNELAERLEQLQGHPCEPVLVDIGRNSYPVSGTAVRDAPALHWDYLTPPVRAHFVKRVAILGPESSGTTTFARDLAAEYSTVWVPEYGRTFSEAVDLRSDYEWTTEDFIHVALQQQFIEDELAERSGPIMFCDTEAWATAVFHELYMGSRSETVEEIALSRGYDLYVITDHMGVDYEDDGLRNGERHQQWMFDVMVERILSTKTPWMCVHGSREDRVTAVSERIRRMLNVYDTHA